jgi:hypothetical protein
LRFFNEISLAQEKIAALFHRRIPVAEGAKFKLAIEEKL